MTDEDVSTGWTTASIAGHDVDLFEPDDPVDGRAVLFLHGHAGTTLKNNAVWSDELNQHRLRCVCPQAGPAWWAPELAPDFDSELTPLEFLTGPVIDWMRSAWNVEPPGVAVTGVSMGGQGALQLAYREARQFPVVAAVSPIIDFDRLWGRGLPLDAIYQSAEQARQASPILHLHPLNWPRYQLLVCDPSDKDWFEGVERLSSKLSSSGIPHECDLTTSAGGHSWDYFNAMAPRIVEFLATSLQQNEWRIE